MISRVLSRALTTCAAAALLAGSSCLAATINGSAYCNIASPVGPTPQGSSYAINGVTLSTLASAEASGTGLCSTFTSSAINFSAGYNGTPEGSLASFLTSSPGNTTFTTAPPAGQSELGTLLVLTGTTHLTNGSSYTLTHDDGVNLYIGTGTPNMLLVAQGAQTVADQMPFLYTGATGDFNFELLYVSNYQAPSELISNLPIVAATVTPEPSSFVLLGTGLLTAAGAVRRKMMA